MADPVGPSITYDYSDFAAANQSYPFPGTQIDVDLNELKRAANDTITALKDVRRSDGHLKNGSVDIDSLAAGTTAAIADEVTSGAITAAAASAAAAEASADLAEAAADSAVAAQEAQLDDVEMLPPGGAVAGGVYKAVVEVINEWPPFVDQYGAVGDGSTDDIDAINACAAANRAFMFHPYKNYLVSDTIMAQSGAAIMCPSGDGATITREGVWDGPTMQLGVDLVAQGAYACRIKQLRFTVQGRGPGDFTGGVSTTMANKLTNGQQHLVLWGGTNGQVEDCTFEHGVYQIDVYGCAQLKLRRNWFYGSWNPDISALQETESSIRVQNSSTHGIATMILLEDNWIGGLPTLSKEWTDGDAVWTGTREAGPKTGVLIHSVEGFEMRGGYIGGQSEYCVYINPQAYGANICDHLFIHDVFFDPGTISHILVAAGEGSICNFLKVHNNGFHGQLSGAHVFYIANVGTGGISAQNVSFLGNDSNAHLRTPLVLSGARGALISDNRITSYNARESGTDQGIAAGALVNASARNVHFGTNQWGGDLAGGATDHCKWGVYGEDPTYFSAADQRAINLGLAGGAVVAGDSQDYPT